MKQIEEDILLTFIEALLSLERFFLLSVNFNIEIFFKIMLLPIK